MDPEKEDFLKKLYYSPETGLSSAKILYGLAKNKGIKFKEVKFFLNNQETHQIFGTKKKYYSSIIGITDSDYQMDSMYLEQFRRQNDGYIGLLNFIEITSRKAYCIPIKNKTQKEINRAFDIFFKDVDHKVNNITSDNEASFKKCIYRFDSIRHWTADTNDKTKLGKIERFNRTIRDKVRKYMKTFKTANWIDVIEKLVLNYNNSVHSSTGMTPNEVKTPEQFNKIRQSEKLRSQEADNEIIAFKIGDRVRILKSKKKFAKGSEEFTRGLYTIIEIKGKSFILKNPKGIVLNQHFKNWQIKKVGEIIGKPPEKEKEEIKEEGIINLDTLDEDKQIAVPKIYPIEEPPKTSFKKIDKQNKFVRKQQREHIGQVDKYTGTIEHETKFLPKSDKRMKLIGKRIEVYWPNFKIWFDGKVTGYDEDRQEHMVLYDTEMHKEDPEIYEKLMRNNDFKTPIAYWKYL